MARNLVPEVVEEIGKEIEVVIDRQFAQGVNPDGVPWAPPKIGAKPLFKTGRLRNSFRLRPTSKNGFQITSDAIESRPAVRKPRKSTTVIPRGARKYAIIVQGKRSIVWRRRHSGKLWRAAIRKAIKRVMKKYEAKK